MVTITVHEVDDRWFGIALDGHRFVATAVEHDAPAALTAVRRCLPRGTDAAFTDAPSPFAVASARALAALEAGSDEHDRFVLAVDHLSAPHYRIYSVAMAIPVGYVSTYGGVAKAARSEARAVGRAMATNPLYPIVPCHRVVGADFSMVGYGGSQDDEALSSKLSRLAAEARGRTDATEIPAGPGLLTIYPVEWVLEARHEADERLARVREARARRAVAESMQLQLF